MMNSIKRFVREEEGVTMVEYGLACRADFDRLYRRDQGHRHSTETVFTRIATSSTPRYTVADRMQSGWSSLQPFFSIRESNMHELANQKCKELPVRRRTAVTSIEYALLGVLIAVVCVAAVKTVGTNLSALFTNACNKVTEAISGAPAC